MYSCDRLVDHQIIFTAKTLKNKETVEVAYTIKIVKFN